MSPGAGALPSPFGSLGLARGLCEALAVLQRLGDVGTALLRLVVWWGTQNSTVTLRKTHSRGGRMPLSKRHQVLTETVMAGPWWTWVGRSVAPSPQ